MHFVTIGCGRAGATLAKGVITHGHSLTMIDSSPDSFRKLPKNFEGQKVTSEGYDRDTQRQAGIEDAHDFVAVADDDNASILAARITREIYRMKRVVTRVTGPHRAEVYERLGIPTVGTVDHIAQSLLSRVLLLDSEAIFTEGTGKLVLRRALLEMSWVGHTMAEIQQVLKVRAAYVSRLSRVALVGEDTILQGNDELYFPVTTSRRPVTTSRLARAFKED